MTALTAASFSNGLLNATATNSATLYQRTAYNQVNASAANAIDIGSVVKNQSQLDVVGGVTSTNASDYYSLNLTGTSLKLAFQNATGTTDLRVQIFDSTGKTVLADSKGTADQQAAYAALTSETGLAEKSGQYVVKVSYAPISLKSLAQNYDFQVYSGTSYSSSYQTTAVTQTDPNKATPVDNTKTYATSTATTYSRDDYNTINATVTSGINIGWLAENKTQLSLTSQLTEADSADYYNFTFQQGSAIKLALANQTNTAGLRIQVTDQTGTAIIADSDGTTAQKAAYAALTSGAGLKAQLGAYAVKVSYANGADTTKAQTYNFQLTSGDYYSQVDNTVASAQTVGNAILTGTYTSANSLVASANYIANLFGTTDANASIITALSAFTPTST